ncbi:MAG: tRNA pseudouridine(38-40) synthase TruA [Planctomycetales bacterium]|nr:tRNA pseudouridine(38-40) synthase TruA [Planctomycetales bacterium]NIM10262.1 tRNA pseudouridine(38-40) synthase TruA [Planctomycetales bacterium]NIN09700.1 tRNA pseudouridine(38-40) synthase TruA [Planctomycetales bacterium]NIN78820.1 tRNA pseudouridine(38-40) synthase TruA [Planctomycetales bacterium]NIO35991.1 tRNA pseudouridine(38-40) synthase TruA [Planctomycetales bacterium]
MKHSLKITLAYDGTAYAGWQLQPDRLTVQGVLETALQKITGETIRVTASGRTDAGVHALGQVVGLTTHSQLPPEVLQKGLNAVLPDDIVVREVCEAPAGFHAIRDAQRKRYRYVINDAPIRDVFARRYCWQFSQRLDEGAMQRAARGLVGQHDFCSYESRGAPRQTTIRTVYLLEVCRREDGKLQIEIEADGFLYNMVRAIVGTLVEVGRGAEADTYPSQVLAAKNRSAGGATAPPEGLFLVKVDYGNSCESPTSSPA